MGVRRARRSVRRAVGIRWSSQPTQLLVFE